MATEPTVVAPFLAALDDAQRERARNVPQLAERLSDLIGAARAAWPQVALSTDAFVRYLARRLGDDLDRSLRDVRAADLYLACACVDGAASALAAFDARLSADVEVGLSRMNLPRVKVDEVKQILRKQLLVGESDVPPRITSYDGRGDLRAWIKITAVRAALKLLRSERREVALADEDLADLPTADEDPELQYLKRTYRAAFKSAFRTALAGLPDREQNLLRQQLIDGLSIDQIGALYRVHRATAARWLVAARELLLSRTREALMQAERITDEECDSILRLVQSRLDITLEGALR